jgi:PST family polysaccharide transporter
MSSEDWAGRTRGGILWSTLTYASSRVVTMVTTIILARLLVPEEFGVVAAVVVYLGLIELTSDLGMNATVVYEQQAGVTKRVDVAFTLNLIVAVILCGIAVAAAPAVASLFELQGEEDLFRLGAVSLLFTAFGNIHDSLLLREMAFRRRAIPQIVRAAVRGVVSIVLALAGLGASSLVIGMLAGSACWSVTQWILTRYRPRLSLDRSIVRSMAAYGSGAVLLEIISVVTQRIDQVAIARVLGAPALGLYTVAFRVPETLIDSVSWNVSAVAFPALARKRADDEHGLGAATLSLMRYQALYAVPVAAWLAVLAPPLIVVLFGDKWHDAGGVMSAIAVMAGITAIIFPLGDVFKAIGRQRTLVGLNLLQIPFFIAAVIIAAHDGILAVAWARAGLVGVHACLEMALVMRAASMTLRDTLGTLRPALVCGLGVCAGTGAVRLLWDDLSVGPVLAGSAAGALLGYLGLRLGAPATYTELRSYAASMRQRMRPPAAEARA